MMTVKEIAEITGISAPIFAGSEIPAGFFMPEGGAM